MFRWLPTEVAYCLAGVFGLLIVTTVIVEWRRIGGREEPQLRDRVRTWWVIVALFAGSLVVDPLVAVGFFALVSVLALREYFRLLPLRPADAPLRLWAYASIPIQYLWVAMGWYEMFVVFVPVYAFLLIPVRAILGGETEGIVASVAKVHWGVMATVFSLSHAAFLLAFPMGTDPRSTVAWPSEAAQEHPGAGLLVLLVLLTQGNDVAQCLWGKSLGRRRVAPSVSPGKTWAGLLGGVGTTAAIAALAGPLLTMLTPVHAAAVGLLVGVGGFFGDLAISALKRDVGVKDSGGLLPGHGGVLDRVDSLIYSAPLFFHYLYFFYG